jgi:hypothetical protein
MSAYIAILEDDEDHTTAIHNPLADSFPNYEPVFFDNGPDMIDWLRNQMSASSSYTGHH